MLPIQLNALGRLAVVVGAGAVGRRRGAAWHGAGGRVRYIDPKPDLDLDDEHVAEEFAPVHLEDAALVFACASELVNSLVVETAHANGLLVCDAARPERGDFALPSTVRRGDLTISISTSGLAPALSKRLRERLELDYNDDFGEWARILGRVRPEVIRAVKDPAMRGIAYRALTDFDWLEHIRTVGAEAAEADMRTFLANADWQ